MARIMEARLSQLPVGQGGLHSATLGAGPVDYWYVYDCGSSNPLPLRRELDRMDEEFGERPIDLLLLSHLDEDHVNGIELLLCSRDAEAVALPYMTPVERLFIAAGDAAQGKLTQSRMELLNDPADWLRRRGAHKVIYVLPSGEAPDTGADERAPDADAADRLLRLVGPRFVSREENAEYPELTSETHVLPKGKTLGVWRSSTKALMWEIVPYWKPPSDLRSFYKDAQRVLAVKLANPATMLKRVVATLKDKSKRRALAEVYEHYARNRNRSSMCMWAGPTNHASRQSDYEYMVQLGGQLYSHDVRECPAWISTGDAPLKDSGYGKAFEAFYARKLHDIAVFVLPHHGSGRAFPRPMMSQLRPDVWVAPAGRNSYRHPTPWLRSWAYRHGTFWRVSHREQTDLSMGILFRE